MNFTVERTFTATRQQLFHALGDPQLLKQCVPECEQVVVVSPNTYDLHFKSSRAGQNDVGRVEITDQLSPESYRLKLSGAVANIRINGTANITIHERDGQTQVQCQIEAQPEGFLARMGFAMFEPVARQTIERFFSCLAKFVEKP